MTPDITQTRPRCSCNVQGDPKTYSKVWLALYSENTSGGCLSVDGRWLNHQGAQPRDVLRKWGEPSTPQVEYAKGALQGEQGTPPIEGRKEVVDWMVGWLLVGWLVCPSISNLVND